MVDVVAADQRGPNGITGQSTVEGTIVMMMVVMMMVLNIMDMVVMITVTVTF